MNVLVSFSFLRLCAGQYGAILDCSMSRERPSNQSVHNALKPLVSQVICVGIIG